jgi:hypothetical protein
MTGIGPVRTPGRGPRASEHFERRRSIAGPSRDISRHNLEVQRGTS